MRIRIIKTSITKEELVKISEEGFGDFVKVVVDVEKSIMAIGGELHADEEAELLRLDSKQEDLWGINLYPQKTGEEFVEFDSVINLRPAQGNRSRGIENPIIQNKVIEVVKNLIGTQKSQAFKLGMKARRLPRRVSEKYRRNFSDVSRCGVHQGKKLRALARGDSLKD